MRPYNKYKSVRVSGHLNSQLSAFNSKLKKGRNGVPFYSSSRLASNSAIYGRLR